MSLDWSIKTLLRETSKGFEEHAGRIDAILENARKKFEKDFTGTTAGAGIVVLIAAITLASLGKATTFASIALVIGGLLIVTALILRQRATETQVRYGQTMIKLERERARFLQKSAVMQHIWDYGLPEGTSLAQIQILMGDPSSMTPDQATNLAWKEMDKGEGTPGLPEPKKE